MVYKALSSTQQTHAQSAINSDLDPQKRCEKRTVWLALRPSGGNTPIGSVAVEIGGSRWRADLIRRVVPNALDSASIPPPPTPSSLLILTHGSHTLIYTLHRLQRLRGYRSTRRRETHRSLSHVTRSTPVPPPLTTLGRCFPDHDVGAHRGMAQGVPSRGLLENPNVHRNAACGNQRLLTGRWDRWWLGSLALWYSGVLVRTSKYCRAGYCTRPAQVAVALGLLIHWPLVTEL